MPTHGNSNDPLIALLLPNLGGGGAERVNINLANEFIARGFSVDMVLMRASGEMLGLLDPKVRVVDLQANRVRNVLIALTRYLRASHPSALLACMWPLTIIAPVARYIANVSTRIIVAEHTTWSASDWYRSAFHRLALAATTRFAYRYVKGIVAVSQGAARDVANIASLDRARVTTIYNPIVGGVSGAALALQIECPLWMEGAHKRILAVGSLKEVKDYPTLLRGFATLRRNVDSKLLVLGEGGERSSIEALIIDLGIASDVFMPGFSHHPELFYKRADLLVLSSTAEGFGNVIVEALEHGVPVVSTDCPSGPREILEGGKYGTLVPVGSPALLADAMESALTRQHDKSALQTRAKIFDVTNAADAYLDLLVPDWRSALPNSEECL